MTDPISNQKRAFGFCKYENEEGALRALRLLNNFELDGSPLLLKVDEKTKEHLDEYERTKKNAAVSSTVSNNQGTIAFSPYSAPTANIKNPNTFFIYDYPNHFCIE